MYSDNKLIRSTTSSRRLVSLTNEVTLHENQHHCVGTLKIRCPGPKTMSSVQNPGGLIYIDLYKGVCCASHFYRDFNKPINDP